MNKLKHSPEPWVAAKLKSGTKDIWLGVATEQVEDQECVSFLISPESVVNELDLHNAFLIAAAPEMIDVLIEITQYLSPHPKNTIGCGSVLHRKINDVIEKATGTRIGEVSK